MGGNVSRKITNDEREFLLLLQNMGKDKDVNAADLISAASKLPNLSCITNRELQELYLSDKSKTIVILFIKSLEHLTSQHDILNIRTCVMMLARLLPTILISAFNPSELNWLFSSDSPFLTRLYLALQGILFIPGLFDKYGTPDPCVWSWQDVDNMFIDARINIISLLFYGMAGEYFFPNFEYVLQEMRPMAFLSEVNALRVCECICQSLKFKCWRFIPVGITYASTAIIHDENFRKVALKSSLLNDAIDMLYTNIERENSILPSRASSIDAVEIDLSVLIYCIMLSGYNRDYNVVKLALIALRILQLANETNMINVNHRISLVILTVLTSKAHNCKKLEEVMSESLGTRFVFHSSSITLAILEAVTMSMLLEKSKLLHPLMLAVIHNIASHIVDPSRTSVFCLCNTIGYSAANHYDGLCDGLLVAMEVFIKGRKDRQQNMQKVIRDIIEDYDQWEKQSDFEASINTEEPGECYPLVIEDPEEQIQVMKHIIIQLFDRRHQITFGILREAKYIEKFREQMTL